MINYITQQLGAKVLKRVHQKSFLNISELSDLQERNWQSLRKQLKGTQIYEDLQLAYINSYEDYVKHVPVYDYSFYEPYVERVLAGEKNVLFRDELKYVGLTSGTSGQDNKKILYNEKMISLFLGSQRKVASVINDQESDFNILAAQRMAFGSSPECYERDGVKYGYISGILSSRTPSILKRNTFPSEEVLSISDWNVKVDQLIDEVVDKDIRIVSGIPTYIISVFESILEKTGLTDIKQLWPNLSVFVYAATPIKQYEKRINELVGHNLNYYGLYASTEAPLGLPAGKFENGSQSYMFNPDMLYSFSPLSCPSEVVGIHELAEGQEYYVNIGTPNGFVHYEMKDIIRVISRDGQLLFDIIGRKNTGINIAAEKVSDDNLLNTIIELKNELNLDIRHYFVAPKNSNSKAHYHWTLFSDVAILNVNMIAKRLDSLLSENNLDYKDCREQGVIAAAKVSVLNPESLVNYFEKNRGKGQFKLKSSFPSEEEFNLFFNSNFQSLKDGVVQ